MGRPAKALSVFKRTVGSNPTLSADMSGTHRLVTAFVVVCALATLVPALHGASASPRCSRTYTAKPNDSWSRIATKVGAPMKDLLKANKATTDTMILVGDVVCLPKSATKGGSSSGQRLKVPVKKYSPREVEAIIRDVFPARLEGRALKIARRESKLNPAATSWCCLGLFQIYWQVHRPSLKAIGITSAQQLLDPVLNAKAALLVYKRSGSWEPWALR